MMNKLLLLAVAVLAAGCDRPDDKPPVQPPPKPQEVPPAEQAKPTEPKWDALFDGKTLGKFKSVEYGGEGEVSVKDGKIMLRMGAIMTGIVWKGDDLPRTDYELQINGARTEGTDFWAGITFPVGKSHCSLVLGGWGGGLTGLSSIDDLDASENEYSGHQDYIKGQFYTVRIRVTDKAILVWLDEEQIIDADIHERNVDIRIEMEESVPLGIATYQTSAAISEIKLRKLPKP